MTRRLRLLTLFLAIVFAAVGAALDRIDLTLPEFYGVAIVDWSARLLFLVAVVLAVSWAYLLVSERVLERISSKRRRHDVRNVVRLVFSILAIVGGLAALTEQWVGVLLSFGVLGFAITFALQQPLLSLMGWIYIMVKRPYGVGDRVKIEDSKGDVIDIDFLVTTLWEMNGELVSTHQPSGRIIILPNSVVLSAHVYNYSWERFPNVWNELPIQVAYEADLAFARDLMRQVADDYLGDEMEANVERYRRVLAETPVDLEVRDRPTVNVRQEESWVELRLRYLVSPKRGVRVRNELYEHILSSLNDHPDRIKFPVGRNR